LADTLKSFFSRELAQRIAATVVAVHPAFPAAAFVRDASAGLGDLELLARASHMSAALKKHLPPRYEDAVDILLKSLGPEHRTDELLGIGMGPFFYMPHTIFVAQHGLDHFDLSMRAQHEITRRFTCEFSIRAYLERHPDKTLKVLARWSKDPSAHVRRLVSEGTRPRLPWASRVRWIEQQPERLLPLLEVLKDDPASAVRRSVANHLNDLYRGHPALACEVAKRWLEDASDERRALVSYALRTAVKKGDPRALELLGFGQKPRVDIEDIGFEPKRIRIGDKTRLSLTLVSKAKRAQTLSVDLVVHFVKSNGKPSPKVFKLKALTLAPGEQVQLGKTISLAVHTTRKPYPGKHAVDLMLNGETRTLGAFAVLP
jgi:3-methyladenine DNA glycosylase AlkC